MLKQLKLVSTISALALAVMAVSPAMGAAVGAEDHLSKMFWTERTMKAMDKNKDGQVSRTEFLEYMGAQYDKMDQNKDKMLTKAEFTDSKMMSSTFPQSAGD